MANEMRRRFGGREFFCRLPISRLGSGEVHTVATSELDPCPSRSTVATWLRGDTLKPWTQTSWVIPRDPDFRRKATPALNLYEGLWDGKKLKAGDVVVCADEKTGVQALKREVDNRPAAPGRGGLVKHTYSREGTVIYQAVLNVTEGGVIGHVVDRNTRANFETLVATVMTAEPCQSAKRVFWIVDNRGTNHPNTIPDWLEQTYPNTICVHLLVHASWLNQIELYFSVLRRKLLTGVDMPDTDVLTERLLAFEAWWSQAAEPFDWTFTADEPRGIPQARADDGLKQVWLLCGGMAGIPDVERDRLTSHLEAHAREQHSEVCQEIRVRFRGEHAHVDAVDARWRRSQTLSLVVDGESRRLAVCVLPVQPGGLRTIRLT